MKLNLLLYRIPNGQNDMPERPCFIISSQNIYFGYLLESPQRGDSNKYQKHMLLEVLMKYSCIISHLLSRLERRFHDIQFVIITIFVVLSSVGVTRVN